MKSIFIKFAILSLVFIGLPFHGHSQAPVILSADKYMSASGSKIAIQGSDFGIDVTKLVVYFGGAKATVLSVTNQLLETNVPAGATFENISITNTTTGLTGYSSDQFLLSFGGEHPLTASDLQGQLDFDASSGLYDLCLCDLDGDNKNDVSSVNDNATSISLFRNTSTVGTINFVKTTLSIGTRTLHIRCGDLNGDGKQDLAISEGGNGDRIFILKNNSTAGTLSFSLQTITLAGKRPKRIEIADLDANGKPELIITDQGNGNIIVLPNTSTIAAISFGSLLTIPITGAASTDGLAVEDVNGDRTPDVVIHQFLSANSNIFILENKSTPGIIKLENQITLIVPGTLVNLRVGDLDGDSKPDLAATQLLASGISVFLNQGGNGITQFSAPVSVLTDERPWGIDFADMDGDGKNDIVVASITKKSLTLLNNESTPGNLSFQKLVLNTTFINRHLRMGDLDGDSKSEIAFTSIDDNNLGIPASKVSIFRNKKCFVPQLTPKGPMTICSTFPLRLFSTESGGVTYEWKKDGVTVATGANAFFDVIATGQYTVTATGEGGSCAKTSNAVDITVVVAGSVSVPAFTTNSPVCLSDKMTASIISTGADGFDWTGPAGFSASGAAIERANFSSEFAGRYNVDIKIGSCIAKQSSVIIETIAVPEFKISFAGASVVCEGDTKVLTASPLAAGFTFQWYEKTKGLISGATSSNFTANESGEFYFQAQSITFPSCPAVKSNEVKIVVVTIPVVAFNAPAQACKDKPVQFTNQSVVDNLAAASYAWDFGDTQTSTDANPLHTYSSAQNFNVKLTVSYAGATCPAQLTKPIQIVASPSANITAPDNLFLFCPGKNLKLDVNGVFASYLWSTTETTTSIVVTQPGSYAVTVTNSAGCTATATQKVDALPAPVVAITATASQLNAGETTQLTATGLTTFDWNPGKLLSDSTIANPIATPVETTLFKVTGKGTNGCEGEATIEIRVKGELTVNRLKPANFFSPNADAVNNVWSIDNILSFPQCGVTIYDEKGVKLYESKPYQNNWDGTFKGSPLPNGVYFYIIRCDGEESEPKTGSITLIR